MTAALVIDAELAARPECRLVTIGRKTGEPRELRIWFSVANDRLYLLAGDREAAHWVRNVQANPSVTVRFKDRAFEGHAQVVEGQAADAVAREAMAAKYGTKYLARWLRESLPVEVELTAEAVP